jgi:hypothetical protein
MGKVKPDLTRVHLQDQILAKFGEAKMQEFHNRLCQVCIFRELHGRPCHLLPTTLDGKDCSYYNRGDQHPKEAEWNG